MAKKMGVKRLMNNKWTVNLSTFKYQLIGLLGLGLPAIAHAEPLGPQLTAAASDGSGSGELASLREALVEAEAAARTRV